MFQNSPSPHLKDPSQFSLLKYILTLLCAELNRLITMPNYDVTMNAQILIHIFPYLQDIFVLSYHSSF